LLFFNFFTNEPINSTKDVKKFVKHFSTTVFNKLFASKYFMSRSLSAKYFTGRAQNLIFDN